MFKRPYRSRREKVRACSPEPTEFSSIQSLVFEEKGFTEIQAKLFQLYAHWEMVLGDYLAPVALPLGHRGKVLLIGAEDTMVMNELTYACEEILDRVHAFFDECYFDKVELHLLGAQKPLNQLLDESQPVEEEQVKPARPENLGHLNLPEGKVRDAYLHYLTLFDTH